MVGTPVKFLKYKYCNPANTIPRKMKDHKKLVKAFLVAGAVLTGAALAYKVGAVATFAAGFVALGMYNNIKSNDPEPEKLLTFRRNQSGRINGIECNHTLVEIGMIVCLTTAYVSWNISDFFAPRELQPAKKECFAQIYNGNMQCDIPIEYDARPISGWWQKEPRTGSISMVVSPKEDGKMMATETVDLQGKIYKKSFTLKKNDKGLLKRSCEQPEHADNYRYVYKALENK